MESIENETNSKRLKLDEETIATEQPIPTCKHFVKRKKRFCRIPVSKHDEYCGEHIPVTDPSTINLDATENGKSIDRIPCPLDPKHTIFAKNLRKHLKICNAAVKEQPEYVTPGLNSGPNDSNADKSLTDFHLADIDADTLDKIITKINQIYNEHRIDEKIDELIKNHTILDSELNRTDYGEENLKHLKQTSAILGYLEHYNLLNDYVSYVEYGAGKGLVGTSLVQAIANYANSNVLLIDRASLRHKKDNKLDEKHAIQRIRVDIADFDISKYELIQRSKQIVALGKHLCGAATDFAIQCSLNGNNVSTQTNTGPKTEAIIIALCCHHQCEWNHFVGKDFFSQNGVTVTEFAIMTKMVGWFICGTGMSRERRKQIEERRGNEKINKDTDSTSDTIEDTIDYELIAERKEIGRKCKRLMDYGRICYLEQNGYECFLKTYIDSKITLENVCLVAFLKK